MTLLNFHHAALSDPIRTNRLSWAQTIGRLQHALGFLHHAIVAARWRRLQRELRFHAGARQNWLQPTEADGSKYPRYPRVLGEKWDF